MGWSPATIVIRGSALAIALSVFTSGCAQPEMAADKAPVIILDAPDQILAYAQDPSAAVSTPSETAEGEEFVDEMEPLPPPPPLLVVQPVAPVQPTATPDPVPPVSAPVEPTPAPTATPLPAAPPEGAPCQEKLKFLNITFAPTNSYPQTNPVCTVSDPILIGPQVGGVLFLDSGARPKQMVVSCAMGLQLVKLAEILTANGVNELGHYGTYNCRKVRGVETDAWSNHSYGNAIDIAWITSPTVGKGYILGDYYDQSPLGELMRLVPNLLNQQKVFNTVLTPEFNAAHNNHYHVDITPGNPDYYFKKMALPASGGDAALWGFSGDE